MIFVPYTVFDSSSTREIVKSDLIGRKPRLELSVAVSLLGVCDSPFTTIEINPGKHGI